MDPGRIVAGNVVQISGTAGLTVAVSFLAGLQQYSAAPVAWIGTHASIPYPLDLVHAGVDLNRLLVVRHAEAAQRAHAVDILLRRRCCSLLVLDTPAEEPPEPGFLGRCMHVCRREGSAVVVLTPGVREALAPAVRTHLRSRVVAEQHDGGVEDHLELSVLRSRVPLTGGFLRVQPPADLY